MRTRRVTRGSFARNWLSVCSIWLRVTIVFVSNLFIRDSTSKHDGCLSDSKHMPHVKLELVHPHDRVHICLCPNPDKIECVRLHTDYIITQALSSSQEHSSIIFLRLRFHIRPPTLFLFISAIRGVKYAT